VQENIDGSGNDALQFLVRKALPEDIPLIIGDAIHNLRTAIDFAYGEVVGGSKARFPIRDKEKKFTKAIEDGEIDKLFPKLARLLRNKIKPYPTGDGALWALHDLDIADKHKLLIPTIGISLARAEIEDYSGNLSGSLTISGSVGQTRTTCTSRGKPKLQGDGHVSFRILFGPGFPMHNKPIIPTLIQFSELVTKIVVMFEKL
jgi:hypothetical protein